MFAGVSQADLVAHYEFEGNAYDSAGTNHGTFYGDAHTVSDPQRGNVLSLDGNNDYMMASDDLCLDFAGEFTLCAWVKTSDIMNNGRIIYRYDSISQDGYFLTQSDYEDGIWTFNVGIDGTGKYIRSDNHPTTDWTHILGSRDSIGNMTLYINGALQYDNKVNFGAINSVGKLFIGVDYVVEQDFYGLIDDVRIYNHALSPQEIAAVVPEPATIFLIIAGMLLTKKKR